MLYILITGRREVLNILQREVLAVRITGRRGILLDISHVEVLGIYKVEWDSAEYGNHSISVPCQPLSKVY